MKESLTQAGFQKGATMIEVLVTFFILAVGLLGILALHSRLQMSEMEVYQRTQALLLLNDMANRLSSNRDSANAYVTGALGAGMTCPTSTATTRDRDLLEWCNAIKGASETLSNNQVGAMIGGRGCIQSIGANRYMITLAWQGLTPIAAPPASVACGKDQYDDGSSVCVNDLCRRVVTTVVQVSSL